MCEVQCLFRRNLRARMLRINGIAEWVTIRCIAGLILCMLMLAGKCMMTSQGEVISRPSYGVMFNPLYHIQNSGAEWTNYIILPDVTKLRLNASDVGPTFSAQVCHINIKRTRNLTDVQLRAFKTVEDICNAYAPTLKEFESTRNQLINEILFVQTAIRDVVTGNHDSQKGRRKRAAPLDGISTIGKGLFGFAKHTDLQAVHENLLNLQAQTNESMGRIIQHQELTESALRLHDEKLAKGFEQLMNNSEKINLMIDRVERIQRMIRTNSQRSDDESRMVHHIIRLMSNLNANFLREVVAQVINLKVIKSNLETHLSNLQTVMEGYLPMSLVTPQAMNNILNQIDDALLRTHPEFYIAARNTAYYYKQQIDVLVSNGTAIIVMKIPLSNSASNFRVYEVNSVKVPLSETKNNQPKYTYTRLTGHSKYFAVSTDGEYYLELTTSQLARCNGHDDFRICRPYQVQLSNRRPSCTTALFYDQPQVVQTHCRTEYFEETEPQTSIIPLGEGKILLASNSDQWTMSCSKRAPVIIDQCNFCILRLNCSCSLRNLHYLIPPSLETCGDLRTNSSIKYPINTIAYRSMRPGQAILNVTGMTVLNQPPPKIETDIEIKRIDTEAIAVARTEMALDFDKIMTRMGQNKDLYLTKADFAGMKRSNLDTFIGSWMADWVALGMILADVVSLALIVYTFNKINRVNTVLAARAELATATPLLWKNAEPTPTNKSCSVSESFEMGMLKVMVYAMVILITIKLIVKGIRKAALYAETRNVIKIPSSKPPCDGMKAKIYLRLNKLQYQSILYVTSLQIPAKHIFHSGDLSLVTGRTVTRKFFERNILRMNWRDVELCHGPTGQTIALPTDIMIPYFSGVRWHTLHNEDFCIDLLIGTGNIYEMVDKIPNPKISNESTDDSAHEKE